MWFTPGAVITQQQRNGEGGGVGNLRPTYEPILWFTKPYKIGTTIADNALKHGVGAYNEDAYLRYVKEPENVIKCGLGSREGGLHPTQKSVRLMQALIELTTRDGQLVSRPICWKRINTRCSQSSWTEVFRVRGRAGIC